MRRILLSFFFLAAALTQAQVITWSPYFVTATDSLTVTFDATQGSAGLLGYNGDVYAHTGVITSASTSSSDWKHVIAGWSTNIAAAKMTRIATNLYQIKIAPSINTFYSISAGETVTKVAFVFRSSDGAKTGKMADGGDIFLPVSSVSGLSVAISSPSSFPVLLQPADQLPIQVTAAGSDSVFIYVDNVLVAKDTAKTLNYTYTAASTGRKWIKAVAMKGSTTKADSAAFIVRPPVTIADLPNGVQDGINYYSDASQVTLVLYAPGKSYVYVMGDFTNWDVLPETYMNKTTDGNRWWVTLKNLSPGTEQGFQYLVDGSIRIADPYCEKILDPSNDSYIASSTYPNLKAYPTGKTSQIVGVFQTGQSAYQWQTSSYTRPPKDNLVVYELLIRDFTAAHTYQSLIDTLSYLTNLGVNAIELMPVSEFEGNLSWGYNPDFYFAPDKYYGPKNDLKKFIDKCHQNGVAVIMDMVLNHSMGSSPLARLYWDAANSKPAANNPWFNPDAKHPYNVGCDFNHESSATQYLVDRVTSYWLTQYKVDGFRFDLSKGFTQTYNTDVAAWGHYDQSRINLLERMANKIWGVDNSAYVILEHFADNNEEVVLANYGMLLWGNLNSNYNEASMGYNDSGKSDFNWISWKNRGWNNPAVMGYMESHDDERLMYKNEQYGNSSGPYNIKTVTTALERMKLDAAFFITIPGPKMIWQFGELGYDVSIQYPCNTSSCRTDQKPLHWEYYNDVNRIKLFKVFRELIKLKKTYPAFRSSDFYLTVNTAMKRININDATMNIAIIGNFDVVTNSIAANFQNTGWWYNYFSGDSVNVTDQYAGITLNPGEFRLYTSKRLPLPEANLVLGVENDRLSGVTPSNYSLEQNYPNPFNPSTTIRYSVPTRSNVKVVVYDALGNRVAELVNEQKEAGAYQINFDVAALNRPIASGIYFYQIETNSYRAAKKMMYLK
jgi:glycosidase